MSVSITSSIQDLVEKLVQLNNAKENACSNQSQSCVTFFLPGSLCGLLDYKFNTRQS